MPAGPRAVSRTQPLRFCPKSTTTLPGPTSRTAAGASSSILRTGGPSAGTSRARSAIRSVEQPPVLSPSASSGSTGNQPTGDPAPRYQAGSCRRRSIVWPSMRSARVMWLVRDVQASSVATRVRGDPVPSLSDATTAARSPVRSPNPSGRRSNPCRPRNHPSESSAAIVLSPAAQQVGDVPGLHLQALAVGGEAGGQLLVADAHAVEEQLVDAVRGGVHEHGSGARLGRHGERAAQQHGGSLTGGQRVRFGRGDPTGVAQRLAQAVGVPVALRIAGQPARFAPRAVRRGARESGAARGHVRRLLRRVRYLPVGNVSLNNWSASCYGPTQGLNGRVLRQQRRSS